MDQQDMPEVSFRDARDIVAMLWHRTVPAGGAVVRTEAVTTRERPAGERAAPHEGGRGASVADDAGAACREELAGALDAGA